LLNIVIFTCAGRVKGSPTNAGDIGYFLVRTASSVVMLFGPGNCGPGEVAVSTE